MGSSDFTNDFRQKLVDSFEELVKPYVQANNNKKEASAIKSKEFYLNAKTNSIDIYENEMNKMFAEKKFLENDEFEKHHKTSVAKAWGKFKSKKVVGGDDVFQKQCQNELYNHFNTCHYMAHRQSALNAEEGFVFKAMIEAKDSYTSEMDRYVSNLNYCEEESLKEKHYSEESTVLYNVNILSFLFSKH